MVVKIAALAVFAIFALLLALQTSKKSKVNKTEEVHEEICLTVNQPCLNSKYPCCKFHARLNILSTILDPVACFKFGKGTCQPIHTIQNFTEYEKLANQLNSSNFEELRKKYWDSVAPVKLRSNVKSLLTVKQRKPGDCIPTGKPCMASKNPCCQNTTMLGKKKVITEVTCFKFGQGICQLSSSIRNLDKYKKLVRQLNSTNFQLLKKEYWASVTPSTPSPSTKSSPLNNSPLRKKCLSLGEPCLGSKYSCCNSTNFVHTFSLTALPMMTQKSTPVTCFKFGQGVCQKESTIEKIDEYRKLETQLNSTNFNTLKNKYWASLTPAANHSSIKSPPLKELATEEICLRLGDSCLKSKYPCCQLNYLSNLIQRGPEPTTCFKFGDVCKLNRNIVNFNEYKQLVQQLNSTNYEALSQKYWESAVKSLLARKF